MWNLETAKLVFCIPGDASDPWACVAVLAARGVLLAVSKGGQVSLWDSALGKLQEKHQLSSIKEETPTCAVSVQTRAKLVTGFSSGSIFLVSHFPTDWERAQPLKHENLNSEAQHPHKARCGPQMCIPALGRQSQEDP